MVLFFKKREVFGGVVFVLVGGGGGGALEKTKKETNMTWTSVEFYWSAHCVQNFEIIFLGAQHLWAWQTEHCGLGIGAVVFDT